MTNDSTVAALTSAAQITPVPTTADSLPVVLEPYGVDRMATYDYVQDEFLISGTAAGEPYCTRLLVRRPADMARFNGMALAEVSHIWGGTSVWRAFHRQLMRAGYMWFEIDSQAPSALGLIRDADPERYDGMTFIPGELAKDFAETIPFTPNPTREELEAEYDAFKERWWRATPQSMEIIAQAAKAVREGLPGVSNSALSHLFFSGISQTGGVVRRFIETTHELLRGDNGAPLFDGYIPAASGGEALPDIDVPVIEVLGEAEFQSVRWSCGVSGQVRGLRHRRADSQTFRLYEVAGMSHRETRYMSERDRARLADCVQPEGGRWSSFPNSYVYNALLEIMVRWSRDGVQPAASRMFDTVGDSDEIVRDAFGNALGGLRTPHVDAATTHLIAATPMGRPSWYHGTEVPLGDAVLREQYGSVDGYRRAFAGALQEAMAAGFILAEDADGLRLDAERIAF